jgi:translation initiation factor IF-2
MLSDNGKAVVSAGPSTPVQVTGWKELPDAGEMLLEVESEVRKISPTFLPFVTLTFCNIL